MTPMATTEQFIRRWRRILADPGGRRGRRLRRARDAHARQPPARSARDAPENIYALSSLPRELVRVFHESTKPIVGGGRFRASLRRLRDLLERAGIPTYRKIDRAMSALSRYCEFRPWRPGRRGPEK